MKRLPDGLNCELRMVQVQHVVNLGTAPLERPGAVISRYAFQWIQENQGFGG